MSNPGLWKTWEGRIVDGKFPLRHWLGGSEHSAVFLTERPGPPSSKAAIKLIAADGAQARAAVGFRDSAAQEAEIARLLQRLCHEAFFVLLEFRN